MNMQKMNDETKKLKSVVPTTFVNAYCEFWMDAFRVFKSHLPADHIKKEGAISMQAVEAFNRCFDDGYNPKVAIYQLKG